MNAQNNSLETRPEIVKNFTAPTNSFLCPLSANIYNIKFVKYKIRDMVSGLTLIEMDSQEEDEATNLQLEGNDDLRTLKYHFGPDFLELRTIGTTLEFTVGDKPVPNMTMVERHYFKNELIKSYEFNFGFCIPGSRNTWESIYDMPTFSEAKKQEIIESPYATKSDTFFFVQDKLIMHSKAEYDYSPFDEY
jgi:hypothetical protein